MSELTCAFARTEEERREVYRLRYQVYVEEMGKEVPRADHERKLISDPLDEHADIIYVRADNDVIGTYRWVWGGSHFPREYEEAFAFDRLGNIPLREVGVSSRLMVSPEWRHSSALRLMLREAYRNARERGTWLEFLHCKPSLVSMYEAMGFRRVSDHLVPTDGAGQQLAMALVSDDIAHLQRVRSPLLRDARRYTSDPQHGAWFAETFAAYANPASQRIMGEDEFLMVLGESLEMDDTAVFEGVSQAGISDLIRHSAIMNVLAGDAIVRAGEAGREMFVILEGVLETRLGARDRYVVPSTMGRGEVFGEVAFVHEGRRTADVVALSDSKVLVLSPSSVEELVTEKPELSARLLFNLSKILARRLANASNRYATTALETRPG